VVAVPIFEKEDGSYYCSAVIVDSRDGVIGVYRNRAVMICYDRHFPESAWLYGLHGADIVCVAAATSKSARNIWLAEMRVHAFSNGYHLACANRSGTEDSIEFLGTSSIRYNRGLVLAQAGESEDVVISAELDIDSAGETRIQSPFFRDRRPSEYGDVARLLT
jgi:predicted amidohydrolase